MEQPNLIYVKPSYAKSPLSEEEARNFTISETGATHARDHTIGSAVGGNVRWVDGVLSADECKRLIAAVDASPHLSFWSPSGKDDAEAKAFRDADTVEMSNPVLGTFLWERLIEALGSGSLAECLAPIDISEEQDSELCGHWVPQSPLNHDLLFAKYPSGGSFAPHTDGRAIHNFNRRSFQSVILFLNDVPDGCGGGTRFYSGDALNQLCKDQQGRWTASPEWVKVEVSPKAGRLLFFDQELLHEGVPCAAPCTKYIIRSDVMYDRTPAVCDSPKDQAAYAMFRQAEHLAEAGEVAESLKLFAKSWKLSPKMAQMMRQC